jgi:uncharacterized protein YbcI
MPPNEIDANLPQLAQISRAISHVYKVKLGRGPDRVHCHYAGPDAITCFLEGTLTPVERLLSTAEEHDRLRDIRLLVQDAVRPELSQAVERATGRAVATCTSGFDSRADIASENFRLGPA